MRCLCLAPEPQPEDDEPAPATEAEAAERGLPSVTNESKWTQLKGWMRCVACIFPLSQSRAPLCCRTFTRRRAELVAWMLRARLHFAHAFAASSYAHRSRDRSVVCRGSDRLKAMELLLMRDPRLILWL